MTRTGVTGFCYCLSFTVKGVYSLLGSKKNYVPIRKAGPDLAVPKELLDYYEENPTAVKESLCSWLDDQPNEAIRVLTNLAKTHLEHQALHNLLLVAFNHAPSEIILAFSKLLIEDFPLAEKWILQLAKMHVAYPEQMINYDRENESLRKEFIGTSEKVFKDFFLSNKFRKFIQIVYEDEDLRNKMEDLLAGKKQALTDENLTKIAEFQKEYEEYKKINDEIVKFWTACVAFIYEQSQFDVLQHEEISPFGVFVEKLFYLQEHGVPRYNPINLRAKVSFSDWAKLVSHFVTYIQNLTKGSEEDPVFVLKDCPRLAAVFANLQKVLSDKSEKLWQLVTKLLDVYYPSGKSPQE